MPDLAGLTLWGVGTTRTFRAHWMLHEAGLDYETKRIESRTGETATPEFTAINPKRKIPALVHGDLVLSESFAITRHVRRLADNLPYDDYQRSAGGQSRFDEWASFILMELDATSLYVVRRHRDLPRIYGEAPAAVTSSIEYFSRMLDSVAGDIRPDQPIWGSTFSELDILMTVALDWSAALGINLPENLLAYGQQMRARPAYQSARHHNFRDLKMPPPPLAVKPAAT